MNLQHVPLCFEPKDLLYKEHIIVIPVDSMSAVGVGLAYVEDPFRQPSMKYIVVHEAGGTRLVDRDMGLDVDTEAQAQALIECLAPLHDWNRVLSILFAETGREALVEEIRGAWRQATGKAAGKAGAAAKVKALIERKDRGERVDLPSCVPEQFVRDCIQYARMMYGDSSVSECLAMVERMVERHPEDWMLWLFSTVGVFSYDG